jgi:hypothetical protein
MSKEIDPETECWIWKGGKTNAGNGELRVGTEVLYVHRVSAELHLGFDPTAGLFVLHHCDFAHASTPPTSSWARTQTTCEKRQLRDVSGAAS